MAKYDHGGGCACGLSRFCDCSQATAQDKKDREEWERANQSREAAHNHVEKVVKDNKRRDSGRKYTIESMGGGQVLRITVQSGDTIIGKDIAMPGVVEGAMASIDRKLDKLEG